jgi:hypothetical protein
MADSFKTLNPTTDIQSTRTKLHEAIPVTGTIISGSYKFAGTSTNIRKPSHGMFSMVYDYAFLSSSANHLFDVTFGFHTSSFNSFGTKSVLHSQKGTSFQQATKQQMYNQMAQVLMGHETGSIRQFHNQGGKSGQVMTDCYFINFSRLLSKDEVQKGTFSLDLSVNSSYTAVMTGSQTDRGNTKYGIKVIDASGSNTYRVDSPAGEYAPLYARNLLSSSIAIQKLQHADLDKRACGLIFYQAGIAVITSSLFKGVTGSAVAGVEALVAGGLLQQQTNNDSSANNRKRGPNFSGMNSANKGIDHMIRSASIQAGADGVLHRIRNLTFNNTTELNSTIHFCRANSNEFNYSANPTYLTNSQIRVKEESDDEPTSYITTVGLYGADNELLAVAKLSEPLKKTPSNEFTLRVRLDY